MSPPRLLLASLLALGISAAACAEAAKIPPISEKPYNEARKMLLAEGWQPAPTRGPNDEVFGQTQAFLDAGFREVHDCSGTGMAPCIVYFRDAYGSFLKVVTLGESELKGDDFPFVGNFQLVDELPAMEVETPPEPAAQPAAKPSAHMGWGDSTVEEWCANVGNWYRLSGEARNSGIPHMQWRGDIPRLLAAVRFDVPSEQQRYMHAGVTSAYVGMPHATPEQLREYGEDICLRETRRNAGR